MTTIPREHFADQEYCPNGKLGGRTLTQVTTIIYSVLQPQLLSYGRANNVCVVKPFEYLESVKVKHELNEKNWIQLKLKTGVPSGSWYCFMSVSGCQISHGGAGIPNADLVIYITAVQNEWCDGSTVPCMHHHLLWQWWPVHSRTLSNRYSMCVVSCRHCG